MPSLSRSGPTGCGEREPRVLMVSDLTAGGAAVSCRRLFSALSSAGADVHWLALRGCEESGATVATAWPDLAGLLLQRLASALRASEPMRERARRSFAERCAVNFVRWQRPDVINLHNVHSAATFRLVQRLAAFAPIVWTLHDMWALTGGCCYSSVCDAYRGGCRGDCPERGRWGFPDGMPADAWRQRERFFRRYGARVVCVSPSQWLAECARKRLGDLARVELVRYSLDLDVFRPLAEAASSRRVLGLPEGALVLLAGAQWVDDARKGFRFLCEAVRQISAGIDRPMAVVVFGAQEARPSGLDGVWRFIGPVRDERLLNLWYNAADAYILPSLADNLPNTLLESLAAGTPCVTFDVGGCPEAVRDGETGFIAKAGDAGGLASAIGRMAGLSACERETMRGRCRAQAEREYAPTVQAAAYGALFRDVAARFCRP